jgi:hypothetical protein
MKKIVEDMDATNSPGFTRQHVDEVLGIANFDLDAGDAARLAGEALKDTLQQTGAGFLLKSVLDNLKDADPHFDYRMAVDVSGRPTGFFWMTGRMRRAWILFGHCLFMDFTKREMNVALVVFSGDGHIELAGEFIGCEECDGSYIFMANSVFEMEPRRSRESVKIIFRDDKVHQRKSRTHVVSSKTITI